ncbi:protein PMR5-like [Papaver somniferum]|uniref:protein PMR5-like n=1 Tax=Papaver somniferum TaxID=3469 RepID=UPI000E6F48FD|nr:protein PMR5-like [Papaver somniferum]
MGVHGVCKVLLLLILFEIVSSTQLQITKLHKQKPPNSSSKSHKGNNKRKPVVPPNQESCNIFVGSWVQDDSYPIYQSSNCPIIDPEFNCQQYGRPDSAYLKYKWQPSGCNIPRFNGLDFLTKMKGKSIMFIGDSLGLNQWQSLVCMISAAVPKSKTQFTKHDPLSSFKFVDYGVTVSFYRTPYLVDIDSVNGKRILRLDSISQSGSIWKDVDVLSFNSGHWWSHKGQLQGWDSMELGGSIYEDMDRLVAFDRGMRTWSNWVDTNIDTSKTRVYFQGVSPTHYNPKEWKDNSGRKNCYGETGPLGGETYPGTYPDQMGVIQSVIRDMKTPTYLLDITVLSELRKDGHPSIYSGNVSPDQRLNPNRSSDCSHWCLPGLPDTWNQLFYATI